MASQLGARKNDKFLAISTAPSINKTPRGPHLPEIPYPVFFDLSLSDGTVTSVRFNGEPAYVLHQSTQPHCMGDEQGTAGGVKSGTFNGEINPVSASSTVRVGGKQIVRAGDRCTLNKGNCPGKYVTASAPAGLSKQSPAVHVQILSNQREVCPDGRIQLTAIGTPAGGQYEWHCDKPGKLVDESGSPKTTGKMVYIEVDHDNDNDVTKGSLSVCVTYTSNGKKAKHSKSFRIHPPVPLWIVHGLWIGRFSSVLSGDRLGARDAKGILHQAPSNAFNFREQPYSLIVVPGMNMRYQEALNMQKACNYTFKVHSSALIQNYTHGLALSGDLVQSIASEALGAVDRNAKAMADAILKGLRTKGEVYIVAHSQGSEISAKSFRLLSAVLTQNEMARIHYQGFGSETYIHNLYGLGSIRNVRTIGDLIPATGAVAKRAVAALAINRLLPSLLPDPKNILDLHRSLEDLRGLEKEDWEWVDSPVKFPHFFNCRVPTFQRHNFLNNYWMHLRIPSRGSGMPDDEPAKHSLYSVEEEKIEKWHDPNFKKTRSAGFKVLGAAMINASA